ncbi:MAG: hypothetical protein KC910_36725, partial [Candidatus Eremiobacteraeota bacterium]|nr:hypothetical protein [Candidatus Eremiobacteraeota bacterium]
MRISQAKAGNSLLGVILFTLVLSTMLLTLVASMTTDLRLVTAQGNRAQAELCADSAIYEAIAELKRDPEFAGEIHYQPTQSEDLEG